MSIYISYNHKSRDYAERLFKGLKRRGIDTWYDGLINVGDNWGDAIRQNLEACDGVIIILTPEAVASPTIQNEIAHIKSLDKKVFPLLLENITENPFPQLQYLDVRDRELPSKQFFQQLKALSIQDRLAGDTTTDPPRPDVSKKKKK